MRVAVVRSLGSGWGVRAGSKERREPEDVSMGISIGVDTLVEAFWQVESCGVQDSAQDRSRV